MSLCGNICNTCFYSNFNKFNFNNLLKRIGNIFKMPVNIEYGESFSMKDIDEEENIHQDFDAIVKSILVSRAQEGATIEEIREDYYSIVGEKFPYFENTTERLLKLPNVICSTTGIGTRIFNISSSDKSQHIIKMVRNQKSQKPINNFYKKNYNTIPNQNSQYHNQYNNSYSQSRYRSGHNPIEQNISGSDYNPKYFGNDNNCYFADNYQYLRKFGLGSSETLYSSYSKGSSNWSNSGSNQYWYSDENDSAHIYDYQLMGDDFFLSMAKMELGCRYKTENGILHAGLCISGQTINEANNLVQTMNKISRRLIINLGSVDILQGHHLVDIQHDYFHLLNNLELRGIRPILTTLAPIANHNHRPEIRRIVERFNEFIRSLGYPYIDVWKSLANEYGNTLYDCYQSGARRVTGSNHPHVFWNKIGRQRVLNNIKAHLEYLPLD